MFGVGEKAESDAAACCSKLRQMVAKWRCKLIFIHGWLPQCMVELVQEHGGTLRCFCGRATQLSTERSSDFFGRRIFDFFGRCGGGWSTHARMHPRTHSHSVSVSVAVTVVACLLASRVRCLYDREVSLLQGGVSAAERDDPTFQWTCRESAADLATDLRPTRRRGDAATRSLRRARC